MRTKGRLAAPAVHTYEGGRLRYGRWTGSIPRLSTAEERSAVADRPASENRSYRNLARTITRALLGREQLMSLFLYLREHLPHVDHSQLLLARTEMLAEQPRLAGVLVSFDAVV